MAARKNLSPRMTSQLQTSCEYFRLLMQNSLNSDAPLRSLLASQAPSEFFCVLGSILLQLRIYHDHIRVLGFTPGDSAARTDGP